MILVMLIYSCGLVTPATVFSMESITVHSTSNIWVLKLYTVLYMIIKIRDYVDRHFQETKQEYNDVDDVILKSPLVYQYLHIRHFRKYLTIDKILELNNNEIGLIGPGNGCLTQFLERILGQSAVLHSHSILHDAYGRFYTHHSLDRGYTYTIPENITPKCVKGSPLCGQISGLIYCVFGNITI